ncbi:MAG: hypothetical protein HC908_10640 [Calothrix sp. SM1_7_51]|nr:hypothetical protein [Calothrix sp. SM1_7_51]
MVEQCFFAREATILIFWAQTPQLVVDSNHPPLISESEWQVIQGILENNRIVKKGIDSSQLVNPLSGICKCRNCGGTMSQRVNYKNQAGEWSRFLVCRNARNRNEKCRPAYTRTYGLTLNSAEKQIQTILADRAQHISEILPLEKSINPKIKELTDSINTLLAIGDPDLSEVIEKKRTQLFLIQQSEKLESSASEEKIKLLQYVRHPEFWEGMTPHERNLVYRDLIKVVWCDKGKLEVVPII